MIVVDGEFNGLRRGFVYAFVLVNLFLGEFGGWFTVSVVDCFAVDTDSYTKF